MNHISVHIQDHADSLDVSRGVEYNRAEFSNNEQTFAHIQTLSFIN